MPSLAFFTTYALLVLFWAEIYYQASWIRGAFLLFFFLISLGCCYFGGLIMTLMLRYLFGRHAQYLLMVSDQVSIRLMLWFMLFRWKNLAHDCTCYCYHSAQWLNFFLRPWMLQSVFFHFHFAFLRLCRNYNWQCANQYDKEAIRVQLELYKMGWPSPPNAL